MSPGRGFRIEVRFDPAWFLSGVTASRAALEDTGSSDVPNDNYVVEEGHRLLTYLVPETAHITVLTKSGKPDSRGFPSTSITSRSLYGGGPTVIRIFAAPRRIVHSSVCGWPRK